MVVLTSGCLTKVVVKTGLTVHFILFKWPYKITLPSKIKIKLRIELNK